MECLVIYGYRIKPERTVPGHLGTLLLRRGDGDYATIDRWVERGAYNHFRSLHAYDNLYERCAALKLSDGLIGIFEVVSQ